MNQTYKRRLVALKIVCRDLRGLKFAKLERPNVSYGTPPTLDLLDWGAKFYCFSILSHFRELLNSLTVLGRAGHAPAVFILARCLYEIGAHTYYVQKHVKQYRTAKDAKEGWKFMQGINMGSLYMNQRASTSSSDPFPNPRDIGKIIRCFREWPNSNSKRKGDAYEDYSYLSEFTHPNMAAFSHYYKLEPSQAQKKVFAKFVDPPRQVEAMPLAEVTIAVAATLSNIESLLNTIGEQDVAQSLASSLAILVKGQRGTFRGRFSALTRSMLRKIGKSH
jgi:hypothetical protein